MTVASSDRTVADEQHRLHKPGVAGSSPAAATCNDSVQICHTPAHIYHGWRERISASQLKALALSPVEYYHRHIEGAIPPKTSAAMEFGTLLHLWG